MRLLVNRNVDARMAVIETHDAGVGSDPHTVTSTKSSSNRRVGIHRAMRPEFHLTRDIGARPPRSRWHQSGMSPSAENR